MTKYLITGATGHLGSQILKQLLDRGEEDIRALVLPGDQTSLPDQVEKAVGDVSDKASLASFFDYPDDQEVVLIHNAAVITIASKANDLLEEVNVKGVRNICEWAMSKNINRMIHVSSVHAIPEKGVEGKITEPDYYDPDLVVGQYAKSKAQASQDVLDYADRGLNVSIVHPSGIIGEGDLARNNHMTETIEKLSTGKFPVSVEGGYDFVDVKDVAKGILQCLDQGQAGENYILSGHYATIDEITQICADLLDKSPPKWSLPISVAEFFAPFAEKMIEWTGGKPMYTPYSIYTLSSNADFSHQKATDHFNYQTRPLKETLKDVLTDLELLA